MQLDRFIKERWKRIEARNSYYINTTIIIIADHGLNDQDLIKWAETIAYKNKVITYKLDNGSIALFKFSFPRKKFKVCLYHDGRFMSKSSRSKEVVEWWKNYHYNVTGRDSKILLHDCKNTTMNVAALDGLQSQANVKYSKATTKSFPLALSKAGYKGSYSLVSPATGEKKTVWSKQACVTYIATAVAKAREFYGDNYREITLGEIDHLAMLRFEANPKINKEY